MYIKIASLRWEKWKEEEGRERKGERGREREEGRERKSGRGRVGVEEWCVWGE